MCEQDVTLFKVGDRVRLINPVGRFTRKYFPGLHIGSVGTVLEVSIAPWVRFDEPTGYGAHKKAPMICGAPTDFVACINQDDLVSIDPPRAETNNSGSEPSNDVPCRDLRRGQFRLLVFFIGVAIVTYVVACILPWFVR